MRKRKLLSIVLSLALVFSMTTAFTIAVSADDQPTGVVTIKTPSEVVVCNKTLDSSNKYLYYNSENSLEQGSSLPSGYEGGYAYFNTENSASKLELHKFAVNDYSVAWPHNDVIKVYNSSNDPQKTYTVYIELYGENTLDLDSSNGGCAIFAGNSFLNITAGDQNAKLTANATIAAERGIQINSGDINLNNSADSQEFGLATIDWESNNNLTGDVIIKGGSVDIENFDCGIKSSAAVEIGAGEVFIGGNLDKGIVATDDIDITGGKVTIKDFFIKGIESEKDNVNISAGEVSVTAIDTGKYYGASDFSSSCEASRYAINAKNNVNISGIANVTLDGKKKSGVGIYTSGDVIISGGELNIKGFHSGIFFKDTKDSIYLAISDAKVCINAWNDGVGGDVSKTTIKNSDVEILSEGTEYGNQAFWRYVDIQGNPVIYAGDSKEKAALISSTENLSQYQYVHIFKEQKSFFGTIGALFSNIISWISGFKTGTFLSNSFIWKLCSAFKFF